MDNGIAALSSDLLVRHAAALKERIAAGRAQVAGLTEELRRNERELQLLQEIMRLRDDDIEVDQLPPLIETEGVTPPVAAVTEQRDGVRLADAVVEILRKHGQQMHIQELTAAVREAGLQIPGRGDPANLIAHIRTHPSIVRPVRGMYGLREWGLVEKPPLPRTTRTKGSRTTTKPRTRRAVRRGSSSKRDPKDG